MSEDSPPNKFKWWFHRRIMCYMGIFGLVGLAAIAIIFPVSTASAELLKYAGLGCCLLILQYMGTSVVDAIRAWRCTDND